MSKNLFLIVFLVLAANANFSQRLDVGINGGFLYEKSNLTDVGGKQSSSVKVDRSNFIGGNADFKTKFFLHRINVQFETMDFKNSYSNIEPIWDYNIRSSNTINQTYIGLNYTFGVKPFKSVGIYPLLGFSSLIGIGGEHEYRYDAEIGYPPKSEHIYTKSEFKSNPRYILSPGILLWQPVGNLFGFELLMGYRLPLNRILYSNTSLKLRGFYVEFGLTVKVFDKYSQQEQ